MIDLYFEVISPSIDSIIFVLIAWVVQILCTSEIQEVRFSIMNSAFYKNDFHGVTIFKMNKAI